MIGTLIMGGMALAGGIFKAIKSGKEKKEYQKLIANYKRIEQTNPFANLRTSTLGAIRLQESSAQNTATALYNLRKGGANAILGGTGKVLKQSNDLNSKIMGNLDKEKTKNDYLAALGEERKLQRTTRIEEQDLAGLGNAMNVANQNMWGGIESSVQGFGVAAGVVGQGLANQKNGLDFFEETD